ncbi:long-chain-fatty-acid--CoA ligase [Duganella qianjiadongensis]|uniref:Long-chain-fatty-acid--CoA ligase n=1 Tax=Duganella qianjiadongensis TaxID=2692176 RepID=A0ABW9VGW1_9BURK|nr:long-chain-fatty-acid--CoA ligase [Duganella qianjiadongensis]MYM37972.1 long-chain-fatty-acid--CoA ligase [Duganella qianjiadongensis]
MTELCTSPLPGQMMRRPLLITSLLRHAQRYFGQREIVSYGEHGKVHRYTYADCHLRARRLAQTLESYPVRMGERVATLAWNSFRHLELYYGVAGIGAVLHTLNPRLHLEQLIYIINDAGSTMLYFEPAFIEQVSEIAQHCPGIVRYIALCDDEDLPVAAQLPQLQSYEAHLCSDDARWNWPIFDEDAASGLCYTSGTTGNPKGVLYSHRSTVLHAYAQVAPDAFNLSASDCILPVVPMFHVNAWGLPYSAALVGAKLVLPGALLSGSALHAMCHHEQVTFSAGVPTIWLSVLNFVRQHGSQFQSLRRIVIGGTACPPALMDSLRDEYGLQVIHAFGMTELSPLATVCTPQAQHQLLDRTELRSLLQKQGHVLYGIDVRIIDDAGHELAWDGTTPGHLQVRGQWVIDSYFGHSAGSAVDQGWFTTGDVANISADGYVQITDRSKDLIKSGGEWISSIDLENIAMSHPAVHLAACVGVFHDKWEERPLLLIACKPDVALQAEEVLALYQGQVAKWWIPDAVVFVDKLPLGPTGKILKHRIRAEYRHHLCPSPH